MSLAILFKDIQPEKSASGTEMADRVVKWKKRYILVCEFVESLNDLIGKPLLIFTTHAFITFVVNTFSVMYEYFYSPTLMVKSYIHGYTTLKNGMIIICLAIISEKISSEVSNTSQ